MAHPSSYAVYRFEEKHGDLKRVEVPWQDPKDGDVVVKVLACGICGTDDNIRTQAMPTGFPRVPGHEIIGEITAVSPGETIFKVGDRVGSGWHSGNCGRCDSCMSGDFVCCDYEDVNGITRDGGYGEYVTLRASTLCRVPDDVDPAELAPLFCAGGTAFNALCNMDVHAGELVAVQGIGGLGHLAIQYCRAMGFHTVAISSSNTKRELALSLGASEYIDASQNNPAEALKAMGGAKVIVCTAPSGKAIQNLVEGLGLRGQLLILALPEEESTLNFTALIARRRSIIGWPPGSPKDVSDCIKFSARNNVKCIVEKFPFEKAQEAFERKSSAKFRVVLVPPSSL